MLAFLSFLQFMHQRYETRSIWWALDILKVYQNILADAWMDICMKVFCFFLIPVRYKLFVWKLLKLNFFFCTSILIYLWATLFSTPYVFKWILKAYNHSWNPAPFLKGVFQIFTFSQKDGVEIFPSKGGVLKKGVSLISLLINPF